MTDRERVVALIAMIGGLSAYRIAQLLDMDPATVSSFLKRMVDKGVLRRVPKSGPKGGFTYYAVKE
jgi:predicted transcriptional regulator